MKTDITNIPVDLDREQAFLLYATFTGDVTRTAHALGIQPAAVLKMADDEQWQTKLGPILALKKSNRPGDVERAINRALNFVQAHRFRLFVQRVITKLTGLDEAEMDEYLFHASLKDGERVKKLTTRALADLASALEKAQSLTYMALSDTAQDRVKRKENIEDESTSSVGDMHAQINAGLAAVRASASPRAQLFDAQLQQAEQIAKTTRPESPNDNDDH